MWEKEDLEKLVFDYIHESPINVSDDVEKSSRALITLQVIRSISILIDAFFFVLDIENESDLHIFIYRRVWGQKEKEMEEKINSFIRRRRLSYKGDDEKRDVMKKIVSKQIPSFFVKRLYLLYLLLDGT